MKHAGFIFRVLRAVYSELRHQLARSNGCQFTAWDRTLRALGHDMDDASVAMLGNGKAGS